MSIKRLIPAGVRRRIRRVLLGVRSARARWLRPGTEDYRKHVQEEVRHYSEVYSSDAVSRETLMEPAPPVWTEIQRRVGELMRAATGNDLTGHMVSRLKSRPGMRMLSLGSGPGGVELVFAREAPEAEYVCIDVNPETLRIGRNSAAAETLPVRFEQADLNTVVLPKQEFDLVFCHAALHHVLELERLAEQIKRTLRPGGELVVVDVITRNGYRMWPETRRVVRALWRTLPPRYRMNHTAYDRPRLDE